MRKFLALIIILSTQPFSFAQNHNLGHILDFTLSYRGLTRNDITIPVDYFNAGEKSPTNGTQLILPLVRDMLNNPLRSINWADSILSWKDKDVTNIILNVFEMLIQQKLPVGETTIIKDENISSAILSRIKNMKSERDNLLKIYTKQERKYLHDYLWIIFDEDDSDDPKNLDIFKFNEERDSAISRSRKVIELLSKVDLNEICQSSLSDFLFFYCLFKAGFTNTFGNNDEIQNGNDVIIIEDKSGKILISPGNSDNDYSKKYYSQFDMIIDEGGNDKYSVNNSANEFPSRSVCIIDFSGDDFYTTESDFALAGGLFSSSFILDKEGDDIYKSTGYGNLGAAIGGLGLLYDEKGNDTYRGLSFSIGAGCFGVGLLVDREGNDFYIANSYSQGFGMTEGVGCIIDNKGNDSYLVDSRSLDIGRYNDHYVSMCQGFGLGLRPYYAGGIGLIIEGEGNDIYNTDIFGQGGGYWYGLGAILDKSGHDKYNSYQYSQGSGIHIAVGLLKDYDGWDFYSSNGVSQGCGHDFGFGFLWDVKGNDNYSAYSLSQGTGNANGIGLLIDESGRDGYLNKEPSKTRGYGNPRREYGSLGIFLDASGNDFYSVAGLDSTLSNSSLWGVSTDYFLADLPEQISGDNFKVEVDSVNRPHDIPFSAEQYFIMAKTIEPRFSKWQEFGFRKLIDDSIQSSSYLLTKLETDDHRDSQVMRVLITKIPYAIADALKYLLSEYKNKKVQLEPKELSMMCFLMGESKNEIFKDDLLELTYNENIRVKSTAINALGKLKIDTANTDFINKISNRLTELVNENLSYPLLNKDIAFAFKNFKRAENLSSIIKLLSNDYYGARFLAAEYLKTFDEPYFVKIAELNLIERFNEPYLLHNFLNSLQGLNNKSFISVIDSILIKNSGDEIHSLILSDAIKSRRNISTDIEFIKWCDEKLTRLKQNYLFK